MRLRDNPVEKVSGTSVNGRDELKTLLEFLREGDELVITRVDRDWVALVFDLQTIVRDLRERGVELARSNLSIRQQAPESAFLICWVCLQSSRRTLDGNANSKASPKPKREVYKGRPPKIDKEKIRELAAKGLKPTRIARNGHQPDDCYLALEVVLK